MFDRIYILGEPVLRKRARLVKGVTSFENKIFDNMLDAMHRTGGIGLAANQVGIDKQICVIDCGGKVLKLANPKILEKRGCEVFEEGCLSLPSVTVRVRRARVICCQALDENNDLIKFEASGLLARVIQHEVDHLLGRLIIDYAPVWQRILLRRKIKALRNRK